MAAPGLFGPLRVPLRLRQLVRHALHAVGSCGHGVALQSGGFFGRLSLKTPHFSLEMVGFQWFSSVF